MELVLSLSSEHYCKCNNITHVNSLCHNSHSVNVSHHHTMIIIVTTPTIIRMMNFSVMKLSR